MRRARRRPECVMRCSLHPFTPNALEAGTIDRCPGAASGGLFGHLPDASTQISPRHPLVRTLGGMSARWEKPVGCLELGVILLGPRPARSCVGHETRRAQSPTRLRSKNMGHLGAAWRARRAFRRDPTGLSSPEQLILVLLSWVRKECLDLRSRPWDHSISMVQTTLLT
ncbi:hypothetical protein GGTG_10665 [Gaeumannomyces tritici R3-111a-1]|uniref:Uncharacterized protein n=1 Tax=Gaeumannomyces tritici (strain R3-111a-1) TaxID=644352 RepID=J3PAZ1_GAET3|nr:hypothetical protein GGTG_10665 [Gaeumannomyces tritici R3-111a-1]EJT71407.1 hypothetical protein GGTG_10665 [Gaeumannomyces tritici R3-111a-1]